jgi:hypothetical protein
MFNDESYPFLYDTDFNGWKKDSNGSVSEVGRTDFQIDRPRNAQYFTAGLGYCSAPDRDGTQFYVDLAYKLRNQKGDFYAFDTSFTRTDNPESISQVIVDNPLLADRTIDPVEVNLTRHTVTCTLGFKF